MSKIIVVTPVRNESWILDQFLTATSCFCDAIIVADQFSSDGSREICKRQSKVILIDNRNSEFNEAERQNLLLNAARGLYPGEKKIIFTLDADEIITADSLFSKESWERLRNAAPGTVFYFEKPEMLPGLDKCARWKKNFAPLAFVDDGSRHEPKEIHSYRFPINADEKKWRFVEHIKFMHFAHTRLRVQSAKYRYYSIIENVKKLTPVYLRRYNYQSFFNLSKKTSFESVEKTPVEWLGWYDQQGVNLRTLHDPEYSWHDLEALKLFASLGVRRFYLDNIWEFDWEKCRKNALPHSEDNLLNKKIEKPSILFQSTGKVIDGSYAAYRFIKSKMKALFFSLV